MSNRLFFSAAAGLAAALVGLALVAPQGLGARSPGPFGRPLAPFKTPAPPPPASRALKGPL